VHVPMGARTSEAEGVGSRRRNIMPLPIPEDQFFFPAPAVFGACSAAAW
jgi:hypothetical protein